MTPVREKMALAPRTRRPGFGSVLMEQAVTSGPDLVGAVLPQVSELSGLRKIRDVLSRSPLL
jgi:hypothetical protein